MNNSKSRGVLYRIGVILYIVTLFILLMDKTDFFYYGPMLRKIKYLYLAYAVFYTFVTFNGFLSKKVTLLVTILLTHTLLFGVVIVNPIVEQLTHVHCREMLIYIFMICLTYYFVWNENVFDKFLKWNFYTLSLVFVLCGIRHFSDFVNPLYFIYVFSSRHSYRTTFGFGHANFTGNMAIFTLVYSVFILETIVTKPVKTKRDRNEFYLVLFLDLIIGEILLSTQSRTSILAGIVFCIIYGWNYIRSKLKLNIYTYLLLFALVILFVVFMAVTGSLESIWTNSNRMENITINLPYFNLYSPWTGMGYIASSGFYAKAYGYSTFAVDIYYLYVYLTTGYVGSILLLLYLFLIYIFLRNSTRNTGKTITLAFFITILITGIGQTSMIQYTLYTSMINWIIIYISVTPNKSKIT